MGLRVSFVDNIGQNLLATFAEHVPRSGDLRFAAAFVSASGLSLIQPYLERCLSAGGRAEFLVGLDFLTTEPDALRSLSAMTEAGHPVSCYCYSDPFGFSASVYHPKLYVMSRPERVTAVVGSSNLTRGGLKENVEVNTVISAEPSDETVSEIYAVYNKLKFEQPRVQPDADFLGLYEALHARAAKNTRAVLADPETRRLRRQLEAKAASLRRPAATGDDLFGWQKLVFERLPEGIFRTSDLYSFEREFRCHYPHNRNVRAKIRQILQQLRDLGLVRHVATNMWEK